MSALARMPVTGPMAAFVPPEPHQQERVVLDTGPMVAFAQAGRFDELEILMGERRVYMPMQVVRELEKGMHSKPALGIALKAPWIEHYELTTLKELQEFAKFHERLVTGESNLGDAAVLALASSMPAQAMIDDRKAHKIAQKFKVTSKRTLAMLCDDIRSELLTPTHASHIVDDLLDTGYRLPLKRGKFIEWAIKEGQLPSTTS